MNWTLFLPGALLPAALAADAGVLAPLAVSGCLAGARAAAGTGAPRDSAAPAYWTWLATTVLAPGSAAATAPYRWRTVHPGAAGAAPAWVALADPVHLAFARDHYVMGTLAAAPLDAAEEDELFALAQEALAQDPAGDGARLERHQGQWFLVAATPIPAAALDPLALLGRPVHEGLPRAEEARPWRRLVNDIQMRWHASATSTRREEGGMPCANALWLHGAGRYERLAPGRFTALRAAPGDRLGAVVRGWIEAQDPGGRDPHVLAIDSRFLEAMPGEDWSAWGSALSTLPDALAAQRGAAQEAGAAAIQLVLAGRQRVQCLELPTRAGWWRRLRAGNPGARLAAWWSEGEGPG